MVSAVQVWNPDEWESFALFLLQSWHGTLKVQKIPAVHQGDFGIDYYCTEQAVAYQCYAAREPIDIATRANRQMDKITRDLGKMVSNGADISTLFLGKPLKHWVLLAPLHDSKDVNIHCANKTVEIRGKNLAHIEANFEVSIHDLKSFSGDTVAAGMAALETVVLSVPELTSDEMSQWEAGSPDLIANATHKLIKRAGTSGVRRAVAAAVKSFMQGNAILDALRLGSPDLHEKVMAAVSSRAQRLDFAGPQGGPAPGAILNTEIESLIKAIKVEAPNLSHANCEEIAFGAVSDWVLRCPLDFPTDAT